MAVPIKSDCPHCGASNSSFTPQKFLTLEPSVNVGHRLLHGFYSCGGCGGGVLIGYRSTRTMDLSTVRAVAHDSSILDGLQAREDFAQVWVAPENRSRDVPEYVPDGIKRTVEQAEAAYTKAKAWEPAAMAFRRALDLAIQEMGETKGVLVKRIDTLHEKGRLTDGLRDWAHNIRLEGNEANHDELSEEDGREIATELRDFTEIFLKYVYELPGKVAKRTAAIESRKAKQVVTEGDDG